MGADLEVRAAKLRANCLQNRQEIWNLVWGDLHPVVLELRALDLQKPRVDVLSEGLLQELRLLGLLDRLSEVSGQALDAHLLPLLVGEVVEIALHRFGQLVALLYPLEPRV